MRQPRSVVRRLLEMCWRHRATTLLALLLQVAMLALTLGSLTATGAVVDLMRWQLQPEHTLSGWVQRLGLARHSLPTVLLGGAGVALVLGALMAVLDYSCVTIKSRLVNVEIVPRLRADLFSRLQRLDPDFFVKYQSGTIVNRVTRDVQALRTFVSEVVIQGTILVLSLVVFLSYMLATHVVLTLVSLSVAPVLLMTTRMFSRSVQPAYLKSRELHDAIIKALSEGIRGMLLIKLFGRERERQREFESSCAVARDQQLEIARRICRLTTSVEALGQINVVVTMAYGATLVIGGQLSLGELFVFAGLLHQFAGQIAGMSGVANSLEQSLAGANRVFELLDAPVLVQTPADALVAGRLRGEVELVDVGFRHLGKNPLFEGLKLHVPSGSCLGVLGPPGAGKSTLLSLLSRFRDPHAGQVLIDGVDARRYDLDTLRRQVGVVFQDAMLFRDTVAGNIAFGHPEASLDMVERAARIAGAHGFVSQLPQGYETLLEEGGRNLSGGQRQRIAIARSILTDPRILVLDDPTTAIDAKVESEVLEALARASEGRTTVVVSSKLSTLRFADRIVKLEDGVVEEYTGERAVVPEGGSAGDFGVLSSGAPEAPPQAPASGRTMFDDVEVHRTEGVARLSWPLVRRALRYISRQPREQRTVLVLSVLRALLMPALTWIAATVFAGPVVHGDLQSAMLLVGLYLLLAMLAALVLGYRTLLGLRLGEWVVFYLRREVHEKLLSMPFGFFDKISAGSLMSQATNDVDVVRAGIQDVAFVGLVQGATGLFAMGLMFYSDPLLAAFALLFVPIVAYTLWRLTPRLARSYRAVQEQASRLTSVLLESLNGIHVIQSFVRNHHNDRAFRNVVGQQAAITMQAAQEQARVSPILHAHGQIFVATLLAVTGLRAAHGAVDLAALIQFLFLAPLLFGPLYALGSQYNALVSASAGAERVFGLLDGPSHAAGPDGKRLAKALSGRIEFRDVGFSYADREVLRGVSFTIEPGQTVALVGETGGGKTTILRLLTKLYAPTRGQILVDGDDLANLETKSFRQQCRVVPQESFLFSGTILDNLRWGDPGTTETDAWEAFHRLGVADLIEALPAGLLTEVGEGGRSLSAGERQVVCLVRALLSEPKILVLDEATSSMDATTESRLRRALIGLAHGRTCFIAAHRLCTIERADVILVIDDGRVVEHGSHDHLLRLGGQYARLQTYWQTGVGGIRGFDAARV